jgi:hypothetical protein
MLCAKCHKNEATIHFTCVVEGKEEETVHFCKDCAPASTGFHTLDPKELEALAVTGKKCEFCGRAAHSGVMDAGRPIYWCFDCGMEFGRVLADLCISERPDLVQRSKEAASFLSLSGAPEFRAWSQAANRKAVQILRERRRQDGRDKGS